MPRPMPVPDPEEADSATDPVPGRVVVVNYQGQSYRLDLDTVTIEAIEAFEDRKYIRALRLLFDAEQWATYKAHHPLLVDLDDFVGALLGALGNSSASPAS